MPRNGAGLFTLAQPPFVTGTTISASPVNSDFSDIASALTGSVAADGQTPMTGTLNMNTNAISGVTTLAMTGALSGATTGTFSSRITATNIGQGCLVSKNLAQAIATSTDTMLTWGVEAYDDATIFAIGQPTRLTVPANFTRVRVSFSAEWSTTTAYNMRLFKNGAVFIGGVQRDESSTYDGGTSAMVAVTAGDYFEVQVWQNSGVSRDIQPSATTWFCMELLR